MRKCYYILTSSARQTFSERTLPDKQPEKKKKRILLGTFPLDVDSFRCQHWRVEVTRALHKGVSAALEWLCAGAEKQKQT